MIYPQPPQPPRTGMPTWAWILLAATPIIAIGACLVLCVFGGVMSELDDDPTPAPSYTVPSSTRSS